MAETESRDLEQKERNGERTRAVYANPTVHKYKTASLVSGSQCCNSYRAMYSADSCTAPDCYYH
jgi:hypothetical protein